MKKYFASSLLILISTIYVAAQTTPTPESVSNIPQIITDPVNYFVLFTMVVLLSTILVMARVIRLLTWQASGSPKSLDKPVTEKVISNKESYWSKINKKLNDAVPLEKEEDVLLDHDYDGIKELDNNLPPWWKYGFYITIIFAVVYMVHYHVVGSGNVQLEEYAAQLAEAEVLKAERLKLAASEVDETTATYMVEDSDLSAGKKLYIDKCLVCHGAGGEGTVGPNLTDNFWIHGGDIKDIFRIVKYGVPSKGMLAWQGQLTPIQMQQVSSYVKTLHGTNPPNQKEPQGELFEDFTPPVDNPGTPVDSVTASI